jgi:predicted  nucleic acid-binding Zn-ribbon protein
LSAKKEGNGRIIALSRRIDDVTASLEDLQLQLTQLKRRFDQLRDDHSDQLASLRGRITASERWGRKKEVDELTPATPEDIFKGLSESDRRILRSMLGSGPAGQPSTPPQQGG